MSLRYHIGIIGHICDCLKASMLMISMVVVNHDIVGNVEMLFGLKRNASRKNQVKDKKNKKEGNTVTAEIEGL